MARLSRAAASCRHLSASVPSLPSSPSFLAALCRRMRSRSRFAAETRSLAAAMLAAETGISLRAPSISRPFPALPESLSKRHSKLSCAGLISALWS
eukprot:scaffold5760_cov220-Pinguiococcus_pyrenoidosus.AAC.2